MATAVVSEEGVWVCVYFEEDSFGVFKETPSRISEVGGFIVLMECAYV